MFIVALATVGVCDIAFGLSLQLQPLVMESQGIAAWLIGLNSAMGALGILFVGPFLPRIIVRFGSRNIAFVAILTILVSLLGMAFLPPLYWWFFLRFCMGTATGALFAVTEIWILTIATPENRGRVMGIYTSMMSVTFAVGPLLLPFTGIHGFAPWIICFVFVALGLIPLSYVKVREVSEDGGSSSVWKAIASAPILFACIAVAALYDNVIISFFTIFATRNGVELGTASTILAAGIVAGVVFFYPLGLWADRWSKNGVVLVCTLVTIIICAAMPWLINTWAIWLLVVVLFTTAFGVYVVALAMIGDVFTGSAMVAASATVAAMWGIGGLVGPPIAGRMIDLFGINAMPYTLCGFYLVLLAMLLLNGGRVITKPDLPEVTISG